jgi:meso-butanediol dehydrogenase/(S,S)-butanediol dehydrogenase/diacetyl reductase
VSSDQLQLPAATTEPRLLGKIAVITGSAAGIGAQTAALFLAHGATVVGMDIDGEGDTTQALRNAYPDRTFEFSAFDVADRDAMQAFAADTLDRYGHVDVLFNNAGILGTFDRPIADSDYTEWARLLDVNLTATLAATVAFMPGLRRSAAGSVIHNATIDAVLGNPRASLYSMSKGGLIPMTHVMAWECGEFGTRVNCIVVGGIPTGLSRGQLASGYLTQLASAASLRRPGIPIEAARVVLFLASDESSYVSGAVIPIDGGRICLTPGTL